MQHTSQREAHLGTIHVAERVTGPYPAFRDREDAGRALVRYIAGDVPSVTMVLALPRGGVAVGAPLSDALNAQLLPVIVRKLPIPVSPEMGFGAVAIDGTRSLNESAMVAFGIGQEQADTITDEVMDEVRRRAMEYVGSDQPPDVSGRDVSIVDDGLATGFTVLVAAKMVKNRGPRSMTLAVPCSPSGTLAAMGDHFDKVYCLFAQKSPSFAVASYYQDFHDMSDGEVKEYLEGRAARGSVGGATETNDTHEGRTGG